MSHDDESALPPIDPANFGPVQEGIDDLLRSHASLEQHSQTPEAIRLNQLWTSLCQQLEMVGIQQLGLVGHEQSAPETYSIRNQELRRLIEEHDTHYELFLLDPEQHQGNPDETDPLLPTITEARFTIDLLSWAREVVQAATNNSADDFLKAWANIYAMLAVKYPEVEGNKKILGAIEIGMNYLNKTLGFNVVLEKDYREKLRVSLAFQNMKHLVEYVRSRNKRGVQYKIVRTLGEQVFHLSAHDAWRGFVNKVASFQERTSHPEMDCDLPGTDVRTLELQEEIVRSARHLSLTPLVLDMLMRQISPDAWQPIAD